MTQQTIRRILAIDDNQAIHDDYRKVLTSSGMSNDLDEIESLLFGAGKSNSGHTVPDSFQIDSAFQGQQGFELVQKSIDENTPYSMAFIDVRMPPGWNGVETAQRIWEVDPNLPIVLCTAYTDYSWEEIINKLSRSEQLLILKKPFDNIELRQMAHSQAEKRRLSDLANIKQEELEKMIESRTRDIKKTRDLVFFSLARLAESRDKNTGDHLKRIQFFSEVLGRWLVENGPYQDQMSFDRAEKISVSSILHDIGKVGVPDSILGKPGPLTPDEFETMKQHVNIGADALDEAVQYSDCCGFLKIAAGIARYHHERFNGSGYPDGKAGTDIPLAARIVAVADVFDALTSDRVYKKAISPEDAREMILQESGQHFDPAIVQAFDECWSKIQAFCLQKEMPEVMVNNG